MFGKNMENQRKYGDIKLVTTERRTNYLVSEPNYETTKFFTKNLVAVEMKKIQITINKPVYLGLSILDLSQIVLYDFWYDYIKPKYDERAKLSYTDTHSFIVHIKKEDIYKYIAEEVESRFENLNHDVDRLLLMRKLKKLSA